MPPITNSHHEELLYVAAMLRRYMKAFVKDPTSIRAVKWIDHYAARLDTLLYVDKEAIRRYATLLDAQKRMELCNAEGTSHAVEESLSEEIKPALPGEPEQTRKPRPSKRISQPA